jgi:hypothetical protein
MALALVGCGSSAEVPATASPRPTLTKVQFLKRGNQACAQGNDEIHGRYGRWEKSHTVNGKRPPEAARDKALSEIALEVKKKELLRLREIGLPREGTAIVREILTSMEEGVENGEKDLASMQASNEDYAFIKAYRKSIGYGLTVCWWD